MKKKFPLIGAYFIGVIVACLALFLTCCDKFKSQKQQISTTPDSVLVEHYETVDPSFSSADEILQFQQDIIDNYQLDSAIMAMPETVLYDVSLVCLKKNKSVKRRTLIDEYNKNKHIYTVISKPKPLSAMEEQRVTDELPIHERVMSINMRDTLIDGKKYRIETKTISCNE